MESGSSAAGRTGLRVAPAEHSRLPPLVGDDGAAAYAHVGVTVDPAARVADTAQLLAGARVRAGAVVSEMCLVGSNALVAEGARLDAWCVVGDRAVIGAGAQLGSGTLVDAGSTVGSGAVLDGVVQVAPGVHIRVGAHVQGPQAVWPDHPAAGPRGETERSGRTDVVLGVASPPPGAQPVPAAGASAAVERALGLDPDRSR